MIFNIIAKPKGKTQDTRLIFKTYYSSDKLQKQDYLSVAQVDSHNTASLLLFVH